PRWPSFLLTGTGWPATPGICGDARQPIFGSGSLTCPTRFWHRQMSALSSTAVSGSRHILSGKPVNVPVAEAVFYLGPFFHCFCDHQGPFTRFRFCLVPNPYLLRMDFQR